MPEKPPIHPHFPNLPVKPSYRVRELARYTGFSRWSIQQAINNGQLQALRQGHKTIRISESSLRQYLAGLIYDPYA